MGILLPKLEFCYAFACLSTCLLDRRRLVYWRPSKICCGRWRMAQGQTSESVTPARLVIHNIGLLLSGDIGNPILDAATVVAGNGKMAAGGKPKDLNPAPASRRIHAQGTTLAP